MKTEDDIRKKDKMVHATLVAVRRAKKQMVALGLTDEAATGLAFEAFEISLEPNAIAGGTPKMPTQLKRVS
ncbi:hypothetical protein EBR66_02885 [bacterium]|nr:hypothetical protein [bacterium]